MSNQFAQIRDLFLEALDTEAGEKVPDFDEVQPMHNLAIILRMEGMVPYASHQSQFGEAPYSLTAGRGNGSGAVNSESELVIAQPTARSRLAIACSRRVVRR